MASVNIDELTEAGRKLLNAGEDYWKIACRAGIGGGVIWLQSTEGQLVVFTRGEYRDQLMKNIETLGRTFSFGSVQQE